MKRVLSVLLAVLIVTSCCMSGVSALYYETVKETDYIYMETPSFGTVYSDRKTDVITTYVNRDYPDGLESLSDMNFIDAIIDYNIEEEKNVIMEFPVLDGYGRETGEKYNEIAEITTTKQMELFGVPIRELYYEKSGIFFWKNLTSYSNMIDSEGNPIDIVKADISLTQGNINLFLLRILKSLYSEYRLYTDKNAVSIINFIGKLFFTNFRTLPAGTKVFSEADYISKDKQTGVQYADEDVFFKTVAEKSGLSQLVQINWVDRGSTVDFRPLLSLLGVVVDELLDRDFKNGSTLATEILRAFFTKVLSEGPVNYAVNILKGLSDAYLLYYYKPIAALFAQKLNTGYISEAELGTISGLLNLIFNDNNYIKEYDTYGNIIAERRAAYGEYDANKFQFAPLPEWKLTNASDDAEYTLYLLMYCNINAHYRNNESLINNAKQKISSNKDIKEYKDRLNTIIDMIAGDDIERKLLEFSLSDILTDNLEDKPDEIYLNLKESLARFLRRIAEWFEMWMKIFTGELEFGAGAFN